MIVEKFGEFCDTVETDDLHDDLIIECLDELVLLGRCR
jgi:hypothetical protein